MKSLVEHPDIDEPECRFEVACQQFVGPRGLANNAAAAILYHNHPSGCPEPAAPEGRYASKLASRP
jgi:hypothetical protein